MAVSSLKDARNARLVKLLARCAAGDRVAFQDIYKETSAQLFAVVVRIVKRRDLSEEVLQEAFIKIWESAGHYSSDKAAPMTWMTRIVRNQAIDLYRKLGRDAPLEDAPVPEAPRAEQPEQLAARHEGLGQIEECLDGLSEQQSGSVRFVYLEGLTYVASAKRLAAPVNTVKSWVRRGLLGLKECLEQ